MGVSFGLGDVGTVLDCLGNSSGLALAAASLVKLLLLCLADGAAAARDVEGHENPMKQS